MFLICVMCLTACMLPLALSAQELPFAVKAKTRFSSTGFVGYETIDSLTYYKAQVIQEFRFWKIAMGFDLDFLVDKDLRLRTENWDNWLDWLDKIYYVRYARQGDPFYAHAGGFPGVSIGYGLIMQNYSNMLLYPELRNTGLMIGFSPNWGLNPSFELFSSDIKRNQILSFNARFKPLPDSTLGFVDDLMLGFSVVVDRNQYGNLRHLASSGFTHEVDQLKADPASVYGVAYTLPIYQNEVLSVGNYAEFAHIQDYGSGAILPGMYLHTKLLRVNLEYRLNGNRFLPAFFDHEYEEERAFQTEDRPGEFLTKEDLLADTRPTYGWSGRVQAFLFKKLKAMVSWENYFGQDLDCGKSLWLKLWVDTQFRRLENVSLSYSKVNTRHLAIHHLNEPNASIGASITLRVYKKRWYAVAKYSERYRDKDGDGSVDWLRETKRSGGVGVKLVY